MNNIHDALQHALQSGDQETARRLLAAVLRANPQNAQAWLSMSEAVDTDAQQRECLLRVLAIEPDNLTARARLARLETQALRGRPSQLETAPTSAVPLGKEIGATPTERDWEIAATSTDRRGIEFAATQAEAPTPEHRRGTEMPLLQQRYVRLASGLSLTLLLGLALLVLALIRISPQNGDRPSERALHTATLWCPSCAREGQPVILSTRIGASFYPSARASGLSHGTRVAVLRYRWSALERHYYALVAAEGKRGWVPETQIRK